jgi:hypothetical protein
VEAAGSGEEGEEGGVEEEGRKRVPARRGKAKAARA